MTPPFTTGDLIQFAPVPWQVVTLSDDQVESAAHLSQTAIDESQQWNVYLQALGLGGFERWLSERTSNLLLQKYDCTLLRPGYANLFTGVCNLYVGKFTLCLLIMGSLTDTCVSVPRGAVELPEFTPDFYVLLEVQEEQDQILVRGCLSYEQLLQARQVVPLSPNPDWTYSLSLSWFESSPDDLLLWLHCLEPAPRPTPFPLPHPSASELLSELTPLLPQIQAPGCQLWQVLSWEQGAAVLVHPEIVDGLYQAQRFLSRNLAPGLKSQPPDNPTFAEPSGLIHQAINVGLWLRDELDELAQQLSWVLLPPLTPELRTTEEEVEAIIGELKQEGMEIPRQARGAYRDLRWAETSLRLYAITWPVLSPANTPEWTLLLILGSQPHLRLTSEIRLRVHDSSQLLVEQTLTPESEEYLYARVVGTWEEQFWVSVQLNGPVGSTISLPPFRFDLGEGT